MDWLSKGKFTILSRTHALSATHTVQIWTPAPHGSRNLVLWYFIIHLNEKAAWKQWNSMCKAPGGEEKGHALHTQSQGTASTKVSHSPGFLTHADGTGKAIHLVPLARNFLRSRMPSIGRETGRSLFIIRQIVMMSHSRASVDRSDSHSVFLY